MTLLASLLSIMILCPIKEDGHHKNKTQKEIFLSLF